MMSRKVTSWPSGCCPNTAIHKLQDSYKYNIIANITIRTPLRTMNVCDDNVGCNEVKNVMCFTTIPTLFVYFLYDHIPTFFYIFLEMFFITCTIYSSICISGSAVALPM